MAQASYARVELQLAAVPTLLGAKELVKQGVFSSLQPANLRLKRALENENESLSHPTYPLIFDPQTSGGLLASVPADKAESCLIKLRAAGMGGAAIIGTVESDKQDKGSIFCSQLAPSSPAPLLPALVSMVEQTIKSNKAMLFSMSSCPYCVKAKAALDGLAIKYQVMEVEDEQQLHDVLLATSGSRTLPQLYINGKYVGGGDETAAMAASGDLIKLYNA